MLKSKKQSFDDSSERCSDSKRVRLSSEAESLSNQVESLFPMLPKDSKSQNFLDIDLMNTSLEGSSKKILYRLLISNGSNGGVFRGKVVSHLSNGTSIRLSNTIIRRPARKETRAFRYQIVGDLLAAGGFGQVYKSDSSIKLLPGSCSVEIKQKPRIIKIQPYVASDFNRKMLIDREIEILRKFIHNLPVIKFKFPITYTSPNRAFIVSPFVPPEFMNSIRALGSSRFSFFKQQDIRICCIIMPKYSGSPLKNYLSLDKTEALLIAYNILRELEKIHSQDVVHLDINPANIIYDPVSKKINVIDFGIAMWKQTLLKESIGTPSYMAPEVANASQIMYVANPATDIYSVGLVITRLLSGHNVSKKVLNLLHRMSLDNAAARPDLPSIIDCFEKELKNAGVKLQAMKHDECKEEPPQNCLFHDLLQA